MPKRADDPRRIPVVLEGAKAIVQNVDIERLTQRMVGTVIQPWRRLYVALLAHRGGWRLRHTPASKELSVRAKILEDGGPKLWSEFMEELRHLHLEAPAPRGSVFSRLQSAYEAAIAKPLV